MRFGVLGPLSVEEGGEPLAIRPPKQRALLAVLLVHANRTVAADTLVDLVWNGAPPAAPARTLHVHISQLRRALHPQGERRQRDQLLVRSSPGYVLNVPADALDSRRFEKLVEQGRRARAEGDAQRAAERLREALGLWRGPVLADVDLPALQPTVRRLEEARLAVIEERIDAELLLGHHRSLIGELEELVDEHPLRERFCAQLLLAQYRAGRQGEALATYTRIRARLVEELGIEPGAELQRLQRQILERDPALDLPPAGPGAPTLTLSQRPIPHELPADVASFTGRAAEVERLLAAIAAGGPVVISAIGGMGGVGKSALAIHVAHQLAANFPDGQLYVNLHAATASLAPLEPLEVLGRFLRALGVDARQIPTDVEEAAARVRSLVAGRRLLVVLDDARDAAQVAPLLPAGLGSAVLVTSRRVLAGLDGAVHLHLDVLSRHEAVALLRRLAGEQRIAADPKAAEDVAVWCGCLPLALRVAAARLAARPAWPVRALADRLADEQHRLDELQLGEIGTRASLDVSLQELAGSPDPLDRAAAAAFPLLGLPDGPDLSVPAVARLLDLSEPETARLMERLVDAQLVESPRPGCYRLHDLLRLLARDHAVRRHPRQEREAALERLVRFYTATTWYTCKLLRPGDYRLTRIDDRWTTDGISFQSVTSALDWLEAERANLIAAVGQAAGSQGERAAAAVQLAHMLFGFLWLRSYWQDCIHVNQTALGIAGQIGDRSARARAANDLAGSYFQQGRYEEAAASLHESLAIAQEGGDRREESAVRGNLGVVYGWQGRYDQAVACLEEGLAVDRMLGDRFEEANGLDHLGLIHGRAGKYDLAVGCHLTALAIRRELGDRHNEGNVLNNLGLVCGRNGQYAKAMRYLQQALAIFQEFGDRHGEADSLAYLGGTHARQQRHQEALGCFQRSTTIFRELGDRWSEAESLSGLGRSLDALGRHDAGRINLQAALAIFEELRTPEADAIRARLAARADPS